MARSHAAKRRRRLSPAARLARAVAALGAVTASGVLPLVASAAYAQPASPALRAGSALRAGPGQPAAPLQLAVTSLNPGFARTGHPITVTGRIRNASTTALSGLTVSLYSSTQALPSRAGLTGYLAGSVPPGERVLSTRPITLGSLAPGRTWTWQVTVPYSELRMACFGVYPLTVMAADSAGDAGIDPVPLPFWPTTQSTSCVSHRRPAPLPISWVWPLIDTPHQGPCHGVLLDNSLAHSLAADGRLGTLLAAGAQFTARAKLTWAIDPGLLYQARMMTQPYQVGNAPAASGNCLPGRPHPASAVAASWLARLTRATARQTVFATPYADVDVAALAAPDGSDLIAAVADGQQVARHILGHGAGAAARTSGQHALAAISWPADGVASTVLLEYLENVGMRTVILKMPASSPKVTYTPGAVTSIPTGLGKPLSVLLADGGLSGLLASRAASSPKAGDIFGVRQLFLAETAMIGAEAPNLSRPIVVTPPRNWNPPARLADGLLAETVSAPWLRPSATSALLAMKPEYVHGPLPLYQSHKELPAPLLRRIGRLDRKVTLLESIRIGSDPGISRAIFGVESSAWRGSRQGTKQAEAMLTRTARYVEQQLHGLTLGESRTSQEFVTLGGKVGTVPVTIHNGLGYAVKVGLSVETTRTIVQGQPAYVEIPAHSNSAPVKLSVRTTGSQPGSIRLVLTAPPGSSHAGVPLPGAALTIHVQPTDFGTIALVVCAAALAVFVIASAARAIRSGRPEPPAPADPRGPDQPDAPAEGAARDAAEAGEPEQAAASEAVTAADPPNSQAQASSSPSAQASSSPSAQASSSPSAQASSPGAINFGESRDRREYPDTFFSDPPELTSAGPAAQDQDLSAPVWRPTEER
ncbi:MAG TPA: DUF6049 family protein [Streptosporangiaceae bacterium]